MTNPDFLFTSLSGDEWLFNTNSPDLPSYISKLSDETQAADFPINSPPVVTNCANMAANFSNNLVMTSSASTKAIISTSGSKPFMSLKSQLDSSNIDSSQYLLHIASSTDNSSFPEISGADLSFFIDNNHALSKSNSLDAFIKDKELSCFDNMLNTTSNQPPQIDAQSSADIDFMIDHPIKVESGDFSTDQPMDSMDHTMDINDHPIKVDSKHFPNDQPTDAMDINDNQMKLEDVDYSADQSPKAQSVDIDFFSDSCIFPDEKPASKKNLKIPILSAQDNKFRVHKPSHPKSKLPSSEKIIQPADQWISFESVLEDALSELNKNIPLSLDKFSSLNQGLNFDLESISSMAHLGSQPNDMDVFNTRSSSMSSISSAALYDKTTVFGQSDNLDSDQLSLAKFDEFIQNPLFSDLPSSSSSSSDPFTASSSTWHAPSKNYSRVGSPHRCFYYTHVLSRIIHLLKLPQDPSVITKLSVLSLVCEYLIKDTKLTKSEAACKARLAFMNNEFDSNVASVSAAAVAAIAVGQTEAQDSAISLGEVLDREVMDVIDSEASCGGGLGGCANSTNSHAGNTFIHAPDSPDTSVSSTKVRQKKAKMGNETILRWLDHLETKGSLESDHRGRHRKRSPILSEHEKEFLKQVFEFLPCDKRSAKAVRVLASSMKNYELLKQLTGGAGFMTLHMKIPESNSGISGSSNRTDQGPSSAIEMDDAKDGMDIIHQDDGSECGRPTHSPVDGSDSTLTQAAGSTPFPEMMYTQSLAKMLADHYSSKGICVADKLKISHATAFALIGKWGYKSKGHGKKTWYELENCFN